MQQPTPTPLILSYRDGEDAVLFCHLKNWLIYDLPDSHMSHPIFYNTLQF